LCALGAAVLFLCFGAGGERSEGYLIQYGTFIPSRGELSLKLHTLVFLLPASMLIAVALAALPSCSRPLLRGFDALRTGLGRFWPLGTALLVLLLAASARLWVLRDAPVTDDENVYLFQAELLTRGRLFAESLPSAVRGFFDNQFIINDGRWFGLYFVGHPAVLAAAMRAGLARWVGPVEAALTVLLAVGIARRIFGERAAALTGALLVLSPFLILLSATQLSQPTSALALTLLIYAGLRIEATPRAPGWWALAAAATSAAFLIRPQAAVILAAPMLLRLAWLLLRGRLRPSPLGPALFVLVATAGAALFFWVNWTLTGSPLRTGYHAYWAHEAYWAHGRVPDWHNTPLYPFRELGQNLLQLNAWLFGWPLSLAFAPLFARSGRAWVLTAMPLAALGALGAQASIGVASVSAVGPVYLGETIVPLAALTASGIEQAIAWARERLNGGVTARALVVWPLAMTLVGLLTFVPLEVRSLRLMSKIVRAPYDLVEQAGLDNAVVFVRSLPDARWRPGAWVYFHRNNAPDLSNPVLFVKDLGPERNRELIAFLRTRRPFGMGVRGDELLLFPLDADGRPLTPKS